MAASVLIQIEPISVQIQSGGRASARITLVNKGDTVGQYGLEVNGPDPAWFKLDNAQAGVFPGDKASFQLSIRPPADSVSATYQVVIRAQSQVDPQDQAEGTLTLTVQRLGEGASSHQADAASAAQPTVIRPSATVPDLSSAGEVRPTQPRPNDSQARMGPPATRQANSAGMPASFGQAVLKASSPNGQVLFSANREGLQLSPGASSGMNLALSNSGGAAVSLELLVKGIPLSWVVLAPSSLPLAPGETAYAALTMTVPAQTPIGSYPLTLVAQGGEDPGLLTRLNLMLEVTRPGEISLEISPVQAEGEMSGEFSLKVGQSGESPLSVNLSARDESGALNFTFTPAVLTVPVNNKVSSRLLVRSRQMLSGSDSLTYNFSVSALTSAGTSASAQGRFIQLRPAPVKLLIQPDEVRDPSQAAFQVRIVNPGQTPLAYHLSAADPDNSCAFQFDNRVVNLPPGGEAGTMMHVLPQSYLNAGEVIHTVRISAQPAGGAGSVLTAEVRYIQTAGQPPSLSIAPASQTSAGPASFIVQVANPRPVPLHIELRAYDSGQLCQFTLDPTSLNIPAMYQATARLDVNPVSDLLAGESKRICAFNVAGYADNQPTPIIAEGTLLQVPGFTWRKLLPVFVAAVILLGLGGLAILYLFFTRFMQ